MTDAEWAWTCAGLPTQYDAALTEPEVDIVADEVPVLLLPAAYATDPLLREMGYSLAIIRLARERGGRMCILRRVLHYLTTAEAQGTR